MSDTPQEALNWIEAKIDDPQYHKIKGLYCQLDKVKKALTEHEHLKAENARLRQERDDWSVSFHKMKDKRDALNKENAGLYLENAALREAVELRIEVMRGVAGLIIERGYRTVDAEDMVEAWLKQAFLLEKHAATIEEGKDDE